MKFIVNTVDKTITLEESVNLYKFTELIKKMFGDEWKSYELKQTTDWQIISYPIDRVITIPYLPINPYYPNVRPYPDIICCNQQSNGTVQLNEMSLSEISHEQKNQEIGK